VSAAYAPGPAGRPPRFDAVVIGGGTIGLSSAWRLTEEGISVAVVDPSPGRGTSWHAAGMLAPVTEAHYGEEALLELGLAAARYWPGFASDLVRKTAKDIGYLMNGTLLVAFDADDKEQARELYDLQRSLDLDVEWLTGSKARDLERALAPGVRAALFARHDHQVRTRSLVTALESACRSSGVTFVAERATSVTTAGGAVEGVELESGQNLSTGAVVLAAGCWSSSIGGVPAGLLPPLRPVKGQILRLALRGGTAAKMSSGGDGRLLERTVRGVVQGFPVYLVPRADGSVVLGATSEEMGFDTSVTAGALYDLLRHARALVPGMSELALVDAGAGLRPATPDNAPVVSPAPSSSKADGLVVATGHYRNGILLTPITAAAVAAWVTGKEPPSEILPFEAARFSRAAGHQALRTRGGHDA